MLRNIRKFVRYKVTVLKLDRPTSAPPELIAPQEDDVFFGYSHMVHREGKFLDLWFKPVKEDDPLNFVTFGRISQIVPGTSNSMYYTRLGDFLVEAME